MTTTPTPPPSLEPSPPPPVRRVAVQWSALLIVVIAVAVLGAERLVDAPPLAAVAQKFYTWGVILAAVALLLGMLSVAAVHLRQIVAGAPGWPYSVALLVALLVVLGTGLSHPAGVGNPVVEMLFDALIAPGQATLFALLAFFMAAAAYRYGRVGRPGGAWLLAGVLLVFAVQMPLAQSLLPPALTAWVRWLVDWPVMAALRGVLLGSSLALALIALRFLVAQR